MNIWQDSNNTEKTINSTTVREEINKKYIKGVDPYEKDSKGSSKSHNG